VAPSAPKKKSKFLKLALLLLLLGGMGAAAWYGLRDPDPAVGKPGAGKAAPAKAESSEPPIFVTLEQFTVNLQHEDNQSQYLQIGLSLKLSDKKLEEAVKLYLPEIRNGVLLLLASKRASEIATSEGKKILSEELAHEIIQSLPASMPTDVLKGVLFTSFVIQ